MKKLFLTGVSLLFAATLTFAQDINPEEKAKEKVAALTEKLALTPEQQESVHAVVLESLTAKAKLETDNSIAAGAKEQQIETLNADKSEKIKALLTDEQKVAYEKWLLEKKGDNAKSAVVEETNEVVDTATSILHQ